MYVYVTIFHYLHQSIEQVENTGLYLNNNKNKIISTAKLQVFKFNRETIEVVLSCDFPGAGLTY
jgi:hypothetical protein